MIFSCKWYMMTMLGDVRWFLLIFDAFSMSFCDFQTTENPLFLRFVIQDKVFYFQCWNLRFWCQIRIQRVELGHRGGTHPVGATSTAILVNLTPSTGGSRWIWSGFLDKNPPQIFKRLVTFDLTRQTSQKLTHHIPDRISPHVYFQLFQSNRTRDSWAAAC